MGSHELHGLRLATRRRNTLRGWHSDGPIPGSADWLVRVQNDRARDEANQESPHSRRSRRSVNGDRQSASFRGGACQRHRALTRLDKPSFTKNDEVVGHARHRFDAAQVHPSHTRDLISQEPRHHGPIAPEKFRSLGFCRDRNQFG